MPAKDTEFPKVSQAELDDMIQKHKLFNIGKRGGARAVLKFKDLSGLNFKCADLSGADFTGSNLSNAILAYGVYNGTAFYGCNMSGANLERAIFNRADFRGTDLTDANLTAADMTTADLRKGKVDVIHKKKDEDSAPNTLQQPAATDDTYKSNYEWSPEQEEAKRKSDLTLTGEAEDKFESDFFLGQNVPKFEGSDFSLTGQEEGKEIFQSAFAKTEDRLRDILSAHAVWLQFSGTKGQKLKVSGEDFRQIPDLVRFPLIMAECENCNFSDMYLENAQMQSASFRNCNFDGSNLNQADLRGSNFYGSSLSGTSLKGANLGPLSLSDRTLRVDLRNTNLQNADFENARLRQAVLNGAHILNTDFTLADLRGADLKDCSLEIAIFDDARMGPDSSG